jgi:hypothetical protein
MKFDFVAPFTERYRNTVTSEAPEPQNSDTNRCVTDLSAPTVRDGMVLSIDLFTSLDDSSGSTHDDRSVKTKDHKLYTTQNVDQPFHMSGTSSGSVSPRRLGSLHASATEQETSRRFNTSHYREERYIC